MYIPQLLANEIRAADAFHSSREVKRRTTYIKKQLDAMTDEQLTRFEFFVRSRLPRPAVKEIIAKALEKKRGPGAVWVYIPNVVVVVLVVVSSSSGGSCCGSSSSSSSSSSSKSGSSCSSGNSGGSSSCE
jgi:uncharacterized membrane protein YgcG